jgi:hypothetical protein
MADSDFSANQQLCSQSRNRLTYCRLDLLNNNLVKVSSLEGQVISGSATIKNELDSNFERRNASLEMILTSDLTTDYFKIAIINKVQMFMIVEDVISGVSASYNLGIYLFDNPTISVTPEGDNKLSLELLDLINLFNSTYNGSLANEIVITEGANMSQTILSIAQNNTLMNWQKNKIESTDLLVPSDITTDAGSSIVDLLKQLIDLYLNYSCYFDENGFFVYEKLKNRSMDVVIQEFINSDLIINYSNYKKSFSNVKNTITVLGEVVETSTDVTTPYQYSYTSTLPDEHPFSVKSLSGQVLLKVVTNDKDQSNEACQSESEYNLNKYSNQGETISLTILPDFRLLPNRVIILQEDRSEFQDFKIPNSRWVITQIQANLDGSSMTLELSRLYS